MIAKVFHVLKWTSRELDRTVEALLGENGVQEVEIEGLNGLRLISTRAS